MPRDEFSDRMKATFPDADERLRRRQLLHDRLDDFLDKFIETEGDSWVVFPDHSLTHEFHDIFGEIRDLKISRDCDGDAQFEIVVSDRKKYRLVTVHAPHLPRDETITEEVDLDYIQTVTRSVSYLNSAANSLMTDQEAYFRRIESIRSARLDQERKIKELEEVIHSGSYQDARKLLIEVSKKGSFENSSIARLHDMMAQRFSDELTEALAEVMRLIEPLADDDSSEFRAVRPILADHARVFGRHFTSAEYKAKRDDMNHNGKLIRASRGRRW